LQLQSAENLTSIQWDLSDTESEIQTPFVPTLDGYFLTQSPLELLQSNYLQQRTGNILLGVNKNEGMYFLAYQQKERFPLNPQADLMETDFDMVVRSFLKNDAPLVTDNVAFQYGTPQRYDRSISLKYHNLFLR